MKLCIKLLPGWVDASRQNPNGPPTYIRSASADSGAFQVSWAEYVGGKAPSPTEQQLEEMSKAFGDGKKLGELVSSDRGTCAFGRFGVARFRGEDPDSFTLWTISDGFSFIRATHISISEPSEEELEEAHEIALSLTLAEQVQDQKPWWKIW